MNWQFLPVPERSFCPCGFSKEQRTFNQIAQWNKQTEKNTVCLLDMCVIIHNQFYNSWTPANWSELRHCQRHWAMYSLLQNTNGKTERGRQQQVMNKKLLQNRSLSRLFEQIIQRHCVINQKFPDLRRVISEDIVHIHTCEIFVTRLNSSVPLISVSLFWLKQHVFMYLHKYFYNCTISGPQNTETLF